MQQNFFDLIDGDAVGERYARYLAVLLKAGTAMSGPHRSVRQGVGQHRDQIGAVHSERRIPARRVRHLDWRNGRSVVAEIAGVVADTRPPFFHRWFQSYPLQMPHAVGRQKHAGAHLADSRSLLVK